MDLFQLLLSSLILIAPSSLLALEVLPEEQSAWEKVDQDKFRDARRLAEGVLEKHEGIIARYVLSIIQSESESNLPKALFIIRDARARLEAKMTQADSESQSWHQKMLRHEMSILAQLDRREEQLALIDLFETTHKTKISELRIWPMVKLGQFDDARKLGKALLSNDSPDVRQRALNGLMAVEEEAGNRRWSYQWGVQAMDEMAGRSCVIATNTALGARRVFDFNSAIQLDRKALQSEIDDCPTSPYAQLAPVYLMLGQFQNALSAITTLRRTKQSRRLQLQNEMLIRSRVVELLYAMGRFDDAWKRATQIVDRPDRTGMVSYAPELVELGHLLLAYSVGKAKSVALEESIATKTLWAAKMDYLNRVLHNLKMASYRRQIRKIATQKDYLMRITRPYLYENMLWYTLVLGELLGDAIANEAVAAAIDQETDYRDTSKALLGAFEIEQLFRNQDFEDLLDKGGDLLQKMPKEPTLLRGQLNAMIAHAHLEMGDTEAAFALFAKIMDTFPTALRIVSVALPVRLTGWTDDTESIRDTLLATKRFVQNERSPFTLGLVGGSEDAQICLSKSRRIKCASVSLDESELDTAEVIQQFVRQAFTPKVSLTQKDLSTLDGYLVEGDAEKVLDGLVNPRKKP